MFDEYIRRSDALKGVELFQCGWAEIEAVQSDYIERLPAADVAPVRRTDWMVRKSTEILLRMRRSDGWRE